MHRESNALIDFISLTFFKASTLLHKTNITPCYIHEIHLTYFMHKHHSISMTSYVRFQIKTYNSFTIANMLLY
jgi:hypothetical protein